MVQINLDTGKQPLSMFVHYVIQSVTESFSAMCGVSLEHQETAEEEKQFEGVVGIISLVGDGNWSLMLCLPKDTAIALAERFAGFDIPFESDDMGDVVGELVNVLAGDVSARLDRAGARAELSLPTVARGINVELLKTDRQLYESMHFKTPDGRFWLKLAATAHH